MASPSRKIEVPTMKNCLVSDSRCFFQLVLVLSAAADEKAVAVGAIASRYMGVIPPLSTEIALVRSTEESRHYEYPCLYPLHGTTTTTATDTTTAHHNDNC